MKKLFESRFSKFKIPPFQQINTGDVIFLKQSSGLIQAIALVSKVDFYGPFKLDEAERLMEKYKDALKLEEDFVNLKRASKYATLIKFDSILQIEPIPIEKSDRRSWVLLNKNYIKLFRETYPARFVHR